MIVAFALIMLVFLGTAISFLVTPVTVARINAFLIVRRLDPAVAGRPVLERYLARRRRIRIVGILAGTAIGMALAAPEGRLMFNFMWMLAGWFTGAVIAEVTGRAGGQSHDQHVPVPYWWGPAPTALASIAVLWTAVATMLRADGVSYLPAVAWGFGALVTALVLRATVSYMRRRHRLLGLDPAADPQLESVVAVEAVRGLILGGTALTLACLAQAWVTAVPGPFSQSQTTVAYLWFLGIGMVVLLMAAAKPDSRFRLSPWLVAVVVALPIGLAIPARLAQVPPLSVQEANASATIRLARLDHAAAVQAELGLRVIEHEIADDPQSLPTEFLGRVDVRPAPEGSRYELFAFDRRTRLPVRISGSENGGFWNGRYDKVLSARYEWLSQVVQARNADGFDVSPSAVRPDPESGVLSFHTGYRERHVFSDVDLQLVLMLVREGDGYIYWAAAIPGTTVKTYT